MSDGKDHGNYHTTSDAIVNALFYGMLSKGNEKYMHIASEKNLIFLTVIIFFAIVIALFYVTSGKKIEERGLVQNTLPPPSATPAPTSIQNNAVNIQEDNGIHTTVRYEYGSFNPTMITVANETGCFVEIQNASDQHIAVRLGPYDPKQEKGFLYPSIAPGKNSLIDPRYGTIKEFLFYNKHNPSAVFTVFLDPTCL